jgi:Tfp pilus assembly protein PilF
VLWGQGKTTKDVIAAAFGIAPPEYDRAFRAWALARLARYDGQYMFDVKPLDVDEARALAQKSPEHAAAHVAYAVALLRAHKGDEARGELGQALKIAPDDKDAHYVLSKLAGAEKNAPEEAKELVTIKNAGGDGYTVEMGLSEAAHARHDTAAERAALEAARRFDPTQPDPLRGIFDLASDEKRDGDALDALRALAQIDQHDRRVWHLLLDRLVLAKQWDEAKRTGEAALFVDVENAGMHVDYARALAATGDHAQAVFELESALLCAQKPEEKTETQTLLVQERAALGVR